MVYVGNKEDIVVQKDVSLSGYLTNKATRRKKAKKAFMLL